MGVALFYLGEMTKDLDERRPFVFRETLEGVE